jgi:hypothetical protein
MPISASESDSHALRPIALGRPPMRGENAANVHISVALICSIAIHTMSGQIDILLYGLGA